MANMKDQNIHKTAIIDQGASVGEGSKIWHWSHVCAGAKIGTNVVIGQNVFVSSKAIIGNDCKIQNNVSIYDNVRLGDGVFCGPSMVFTNVINPRATINRKDQFQDTIVADGVTFGANSTILCGINIDKYAFIGAGSFVNKDVKAYALVVGVPAKQIGWVSSHGIRLDLPLDGNAETICAVSNEKYILRNGQIETVEPT